MVKIWLICRSILIILTSLTLFVSCGGDSTDLTAGGGIGGTGYISSGTISAFGSVVVNGVIFDTTEAKVFVGSQEKGFGNQAVLDYLDIGQVVLVEGTANEEESSGIATRIMHMPNVIGPVTAIEDIGQKRKRLTVLGQTIIAEENTIVKPGNLDAIKENNLIEVSGLVDDEGTIRATYVRKLANSFHPTTEIEVKGSIQNLDLINKTFQINKLTVYYGQGQMTNLTEEEISSGQWVFVRGKVIGNYKYVWASEMVPAHENRIRNAERANLEVFVTDFISDADFRVGLIRAKVREDARFEGGEKADLRKGIKIRIKGRVVNRILVANYIYICK